MLEEDTIKHAEIRENIKESYRKTRKLLETKLHSRNLIQRINTWSVPLLRYLGPFLKWTGEEVQQIDQRTRKSIKIYKALHARNDVDKQCQERKKKGTY